MQKCKKNRKKNEKKELFPSKALMEVRREKKVHGLHGLTRMGGEEEEEDLTQRHKGTKTLKKAEEGPQDDTGGRKKKRNTDFADYRGWEGKKRKNRSTDYTD